MSKRSRLIVGSLSIALAATGLLAVSNSAWGFPIPARVALRWELRFDPGPLRMYVDPATGETFWYFTYKVSNLTGHERFWAPQLTLFTDGGEIMPAGESVPPRIETDLIDLLGNEYLVRQNEVIGKIYVGADNALEGLAVWPASNLDTTEMSLFVSGISGETAEVSNPTTQAKEILQKTLRRDYVSPGDPLARGDDPVEFVAESWVMR